MKPAKAILVVVPFYLPGYKAGGPVRSISNIVDYLGQKYSFLILTRDRDFGDKFPYPISGLDEWKREGNGLVRYMRPRETRIYQLWRLISKIEYDLLYLNSCFSRLTVNILLLRAFGFLKSKPYVIAPRGEFSPGALEIKKVKKRLYLLLSRMMGFYQGLVWHASTSREAEDIGKVFPQLKGMIKIGAAPIRVASDPFLGIGKDPNDREPYLLTKEPGMMRAVFLSRISRKKNLDYALGLLKDLSGRVQFDIYGPLEDPEYWRKCQSIIKNIPPSIKVVYAGIAPAESVRSIFSRYHLFLFPTRGENFGHVIPEALSAGCLVLLSDQTPWRGFEKRGIGWDIALDNTSGFVAALESVLAMDNAEFSRRSLEAKSYMQDYFLQQMQELQRAYDCVFDITGPSGI